MPKMRAVQVSKPKGPLELVERDIPEPGPRRGADQSPGLRRLPQRFADQGGILPGHPISARAGPRSGRRDRCRRRGRGAAGSRASASASAGTAAIAAIATPAGAAISLPARPST